MSHLLEVIERLEAKGAVFCSIQDPIDTAAALEHHMIRSFAPDARKQLRLFNAGEQPRSSSWFE